MSAAELVDAAIERIERINPKLNAVITPLFGKARAQARAKLEPGPFRGVPFLLKDLVAASGGDPLHNGMQLMKKLGFVAPEDTYLARKFREAGFIVLGKTNTPELGLAGTTEPLAYGPSRNPWNPDRSTGGSSGRAGLADAGTDRSAGASREELLGAAPPGIGRRIGRFIERGAWRDLRRRRLWVSETTGDARLGRARASGSRTRVVRGCRERLGTLVEWRLWRSRSSQQANSALAGARVM